PLNQRCSITLNYSYFLSSAIYRWIETSSPEYARFLHDEGFHPDGSLKRFKHFCFSQLMVPNRRIADGKLHILSPTVDWYIGMPVEQSLQHLVVGMFEKREFYIGREDQPASGLAGNRFVVEQVETLPEPKWDRRMTFRMLWPVTVSTMHERNARLPGGHGRLLPEYLLANDPRLNDLLRQNILNKYRSLYGSSGEGFLQQRSTMEEGNLQRDDTSFRCIPNEKFITSRGGPEKITKLITIKQGREDETKVRGFMCPLTIEGNPALIALAYESGLG
ncbi:MAG: CRISPR-associated endoribonuclease Cas6, partial [Bacteroidota bacterium]